MKKVYRVRMKSDLGGRDTSMAMRMLTEAVRAPGVTTTDFPGFGIVQLDEGLHELTFEVLADSSETAAQMIDSVQTILEARGLRCVGASAAERPHTPRRAHIPGLVYDEAERRLEVETWAPSHFDLEMHVTPNGNGQVTVLIATVGPGGRREDAFVVTSIVVRRAGG
jgi:hypothetical protein